jgi:putative PIN family toxin of toxin-antitoxin system
MLAVERMTILLSEATNDELLEVLGRPKFQPYFNRQKISGLLAMLPDFSDFVSVTSTVQACRDPRDDKFLSLAVDGKADVIVTGDADLLALDPFHGARILTPRKFLDVYE